MRNRGFRDAQVGLGTPRRGGKLESERMATSELVDAPRLLIGKAARTEELERLRVAQGRKLDLAKHVRPSRVRGPTGARASAAGYQCRDGRGQGRQQHLPNPGVDESEGLVAVQRDDDTPSIAGKPRRERLQIHSPRIGAQQLRDRGEHAMRSGLDIATVEPKVEIVLGERIDGRAQQRGFSDSTRTVDERYGEFGLGRLHRLGEGAHFCLTSDECTPGGFRQAIGEDPEHERAYSHATRCIPPPSTRAGGGSVDIRYSASAGGDHRGVITSVPATQPGVVAWNSSTTCAPSIQPSLTKPYSTARPIPRSYLPPTRAVNDLAGSVAVTSESA